ncbi:hypothetical protein [Massilia sp. CCM 8734]|uniref:hypothetical protein n=1 Tax=Massilia sp. CCM 8734 TaxID=2609283 RepID=UPI00141F11F0|nr:hypothetical protein [Massilia sp. CCM 8734]NHZ96207.1 hypothetical protein [Massilia sp. CCM 8734]
MMTTPDNPYAPLAPLPARRVNTRLRGLSYALAAFFAVHLLLVLVALVLNPTYYVTLAGKSIVSCLFLVTTVIGCINMYIGAMMLVMGRWRGRLQMVFTSAFYSLLISAATWWPNNGAIVLGISGLVLAAAGAWLARVAQRDLRGSGLL